jgi:hypothetical protein
VTTFGVRLSSSQPTVFVKARYVAPALTAVRNRRRVNPVPFVKLYTIKILLHLGTQRPLGDGSRLIIEPVRRETTARITRTLAANFLEHAFHDVLTVSPHSKRTSRAPSPNVAWKRISDCFVF